MPARKSSAGWPSLMYLPGGVLELAAKIAAACRCAQDVRKFMHDPDA